MNLEYQNNQLSQVQRLKMFDEIHGSDCILIDGWWVFSDGAMREHNPHGLLSEPSANEKTRLKIQIRYWQAKVHKVLERFDELKRNLMSDPHLGDHRRAEINELKTKAKLVKEYQAKIKELQDTLDPPAERAARAQSQAEQAAYLASFRSEVAQIQI